jgi:hypothetical protein
MTPSADDITNFLAFAPEAGEGKAFLFLEVSHVNPWNLHIDLADMYRKGGKHGRGSCWSIL